MLRQEYGDSLSLCVFYASVTVLSDESKRFLYDVGVYDNDDDENNHVSPPAFCPYFCSCFLCKCVMV